VANLNRRSKGASDASAAIEALKQEIDALKQLYVQDMQNISADMQALNQKITPVDEVLPPSEVAEG
jgi:predicted  nucleic acid-binding Zn-ribbon protein